VGGEIVHHHADGLGRIHARGDGHQLTGGQADGLCVAATAAKTEGRAGDHLPQLDGRHPFPQLVHHAGDVRAQGERHARSSGERTGAPEHEIVGRDAGGQDLHPDLAGLGLRTILFHHLENVRPAMPRHDNTMMFHTR